MYRCIKRFLDLILSLLLFIVIIPLFVCLCILVHIKLGSPVFFKQIRSGKNQKTFEILKFRTMTNEKDESGNMLPDEIRSTKFGRLLRSSSLDELPELLCIIKGDMSIIGPRPLPPEYNEFFTERELKRFDVKGGLIPPDSIDDSAIITWDKQFEYETEYAEHICLKNDLKIFFNVFKILFRRGETDYGGFVRKPLNEERALMNEGIKK